MRDYGVIAPQFWTGATGKRLKAAGPEAVIVAMYLMTSPHANMIGLYYLPTIYLAHESGLGLEGASKGLASCIEAGFCLYDEASEHVLVVEMARFQIGTDLKPGDKRSKGVANALSKVPQGALLSRFLNRYAVAFSLEFSDVVEAPCKPLASQDQEQDQEQEQKAEQKPADAASPTPAPRRSSKCSFETFVAECKAKGEHLIPEDHSVFRYALDTGIPLDFIRLAWARFKQQFAGKKQAGARGWRQHFDNAVRGNWLKLWWFTPEGECQLTTAGVQAKREADAKAERESQAAPEPQADGVAA